MTNGEPVDELDLLRKTVEQQRRELDMYQEELAQTNAGLLALHTEVERQRQRSVLLDSVSRTVSSSLDGRSVVAALCELVEQSGIADSARVWSESSDECVEQVRSSREPVVAGRRVLLPLAVGPNLLGVLDLSRSQADFAAEEMPFLTQVAARAAVGLRNAEEFERERELAERLQHAMLPALDPPDGVRLYARYLPATEGFNVGGDWFDGFTRADGTIVLTVGDVTGHGLDAAVLMGKLQHVLRAYATEGHGPAATLELAHHLLRGWRTPLLASAIVVDLDPATGSLRWASAGHLPALLAEGERPVRFLERENAPLLGVPFPMRPDEHEITVSPPVNLLLYTDGLVERRDQDIDTGLDRLAAVFHRVRALPTETVGDRVLAEMLRGTGQDDDVCLLLCRWSPRDGGELGQAAE